MALVPCRECGKEVSDAAKVCPYCGIKTPSKKRHQRGIIITVSILLLVLGALAYGYHKFTAAIDTTDPKPNAPAVSKIKQDVPVKDQVIQKDGKAIIKEMLDSGQSVNSISKKTGIRKDEIRKIKKEHKKESGE
jgi:DNA-directed RNA polymerase subunit RPC12/RpoP